MKINSTMTWKERVMLATSGRNNKGGFLWYSHKKICELIEEREGIKVTDFYATISGYLTQLVKSGHIERAAKPKHLSNRYHYGLKQEYLYRQTGKPFKRRFPYLSSSKNKDTLAGDNAILAHEIWRLHRKLPKWFRRMMLD